MGLSALWDCGIPDHTLGISSLVFQLNITCFYPQTCRWVPQRKVDPDRMVIYLPFHYNLHMVVK